MIRSPAGGTTHTTAETPMRFMSHLLLNRLIHLDDCVPYISDLPIYIQFYTPQSDSLSRCCSAAAEKPRSGNPCGSSAPLASGRGRWWTTSCWTGGGPPSSLTTSEGFSHPLSLALTVLKLVRAAMVTLQASAANVRTQSTAFLPQRWMRMQPGSARSNNSVCRRGYLHSLREFHKAMWN
jgi:hypothetical protein